MKPKYLLLAVTALLWVVLDWAAWHFFAGPNRHSLVGEACQVSILFGEVQCGTFLLVMGTGRLPVRVQGGLLVALAAQVLASCPATRLQIHDDVVQMAFHQAIVLAAVFGILRFAGIRLRNKCEAAADSAPLRQYSLSQLMLATAAVAGVCMVLRQLDHNLVDIWLLVSFFALVFALLCLVAIRAALTDKNWWFNYAVAIVLLIAVSNLAAIIRSAYYSAWEFAMLLSGPMILVYISCLTLRAFGWRLVWQRTHSVSPASTGTLIA